MNLYFKINFIYPNCPFSEPLIEQTFMVKAEEGQEETKALWIIQEWYAVHDKRYWKMHESRFVKKMDCGNAGFLGRIKSSK